MRTKEIVLLTKQCRAEEVINYSQMCRPAPFSSLKYSS